jgi:hypothetical protein
MTRPHRHALLVCLGGAGAALLGALGIAGWRIFQVLHRTLELFYGDRGDPVPVPDLTAALLAIAGVLLLVGAGVLAARARRAALALERASLIELL